MARTQAADYDLRRLAIVDTAARLFARDGFLGTSVSDLSKACGISKSLIYHYFPSKEDVLYEVMASHVEQLNRTADGVDAPSPHERLSQLIRGFMRDYIGAADRQKVLVNDLDNLPAARRDAIVVKQRRLIDIVQSALCELAPGLAEDAPAARVETMLLFGMINWTHIWFDPAGPVSPEALADRVVSKLPTPAAPARAAAKAPVRRRSRA